MSPDDQAYPIDREALTEFLREGGREMLPGHLGFEIIEIANDSATLRCPLKPFHHAPNGYLHAGTVISLADTAAGYGCVGNLPAGGTGFTTIEMKANFLGTVREGVLVAVASMIHGGRSTQVWDVDVSEEAKGKSLAAFRCTQMILYPRS